MKRMISLLLAAVLTVGLLSGCGGSKPSTKPTAPAQSTSAQQGETPQEEQQEPQDSEPAVPPAEPDSSVPQEEATPPVEEPPAEVEPAQGEDKEEDPAPPKEEAPAASKPAEKEETKPQEETTKPSDSSSSKPADTGIKALLNAAPLSPMKTNNADLDATVEKILKKITTDSMSTYDKVLACYDYLMANTKYQTKDEATLIRGDVYVSREDYKIVVLAAELFETGKGVCDHYAAALQVLTRRIGLESYICTGLHSSQKGGMGGHVWTIITLDGKDYIFDAQVDDNSNQAHKRFGKTFEEMGNKYQDYNPAQNKRDFGKFQLVGSASSSSSGGPTFLDEFFARHEQMTQFLAESMDYSKAAAKAATALRAEYGMSKMRADEGAIMATCYAAMENVAGYPIENQEIAELMLEQGVSFRYVTLIPLGSYVPPEEMVYTEVAAFTNANFDGFAAGVFQGEWVVLFYGG